MPDKSNQEEVKKLLQIIETIKIWFCNCSNSGWEDCSNRKK